MNREQIKPNQAVEDPRIGVFVCDCGSNIAGHLDCADVAEYARTLDHVVYAKENLYTCSESGIGQIKKAIIAENLNRVVVASCSPRTHQPLFSSSCAEAGLNPYLFEMVNIRDQCSWVHMGQRDRATEKAKQLIRMGVAKSAGLEPQEEIESDLTRKILVLGGGIAGLSAAQALSDMNLEVILVEKAGKPGGLLNQVGLLETGEAAEDRINTLVNDLESRSNVTIYTHAQVAQTSGYIGNFEVKIDTGDAVVEDFVGAMVVAVGANPLVPDNLFGYGQDHVITLMELEQRLKKGDLGARRVVFIQCAGARDENRGYCSRICCAIAVKNAMAVKEQSPSTDVRVLYRDMQMYGTHKEKMLWDARGKGVRFDVYGTDKMPEVEKDHLTFAQTVTGQTQVIDLDPEKDLVVLSTPLVPRESTAGLANMLRVPMDQNGFLLEAHAKLRPLDFAADGIFVCGSGRYPATSAEARTQGIGVASRVAAILFKEKLVKSAIVAKINPDSCVGCKACLTMCPYEAISFNREAHVCKINEVLCKGCGNCAATCPSHSAQLRGFKPDQLLAQIGAV